MTLGCRKPSWSESSRAARNTSAMPIKVLPPGRRIAAWPIDSASSAGGSRIHSATYSSTPRPPPSESTTNAIRKSSGSTPK